MENQEPDSPSTSYATAIANDSYEWYKRAAIGSRTLYRISEAAIILVSAAVPLSAVAFSGNVLIPAILGSIVVVVTGLKAIFHWQENYLRFSRAREAVEAERRKFRTGASPYGDASTRDAVLVESVTRIESEEMSQWLHVFTQSRERTN